MKNLSKYIEEKLVINKDYKEITNHEDKEFNYTELPEFILDNFAIYNPLRIDKLDLPADKRIIKINTLSNDRYGELYDELLQLFRDNNVNNVHARNITFTGNGVAVNWLPEETQKSYNIINKPIWPDDSHRLFATNNFYIWYDTESEKNTIQIIYWRIHNDIVFYCKIHY